MRRQSEWCFERAWTLLSKAHAEVALLDQIRNVYYPSVCGSFYYKAPEYAAEKSHLRELVQAGQLCRLIVPGLPRRRSRARPLFRCNCSTRLLEIDTGVIPNLREHDCVERSVYCLPEQRSVAQALITGHLDALNSGK